MKMDNEWIEFVARFGGKPFEIAVPVSNVMGIFARENGKGMAFEAEKYQPQDKDDTLTVTKTPEKSAEKTPEKTEKPLSGSLKVVKKKPKTE